MKRTSSWTISRDGSTASLNGSGSNHAGPDVKRIKQESQSSLGNVTHPIAKIGNEYLPTRLTQIKPIEKKEYTIKLSRGVNQFAIANGSAIKPVNVSGTTPQTDQVKSKRVTIKLPTAKMAPMFNMFSNNITSSSSNNNKSNIINVNNININNNKINTNNNIVATSNNKVINLKKMAIIPKLEPITIAPTNFFVKQEVESQPDPAFSIDPPIVHGQTLEDIIDRQIMLKCVDLDTLVTNLSAEFYEKGVFGADTKVIYILEGEGTASSPLNEYEMLRQVCRDTQEKYANVLMSIRAEMSDPTNVWMMIHDIQSCTKPTQDDLKPNIFESMVEDQTFLVVRKSAMIPQELKDWSSEHVKMWLRWASESFNLVVNIESQNVTGADVAGWTSDDIYKLVDKGMGDDFYAHVAVLQTYGVVASPPGVYFRGKKKGGPKKSRKPKKEPGTLGERGTNGQVQLWQFLLRCLLEGEHSKLIGWTSEAGDFKFHNPTEFAKAWGMTKQKSDMTYEKMSRALRYYYEHDYISKSSGSRFQYKFIFDTKKVFGLDLNQLRELFKDPNELISCFDKIESQQALYSYIKEALRSPYCQKRGVLPNTNGIIPSDIVIEENVGGYSGFEIPFQNPDQVEEYSTFSFVEDFEEHQAANSSSDDRSSLSSPEHIEVHNLESEDMARTLGLIEEDVSLEESVNNCYNTYFIKQ